MEKNLTSNNNGAVDEELLRGFFADSVRMRVADNGFSRRVMMRLPDEMPVRQCIAYNVWTAVCTVLCVVAFFAGGGIGACKQCLHAVWLSMADNAARLHAAVSLPRVSWESLMQYAAAPDYTPLVVLFTLTVLCAVAWYDVRESQL